MKSVHPQYGYGMTLSACLWLGLFPLLQKGTYATLTHDKWIISLFLTALTFLCFVFDFFFHHHRKTSNPGDVILSEAEGSPPVTISFFKKPVAAKNIA